MLGLNAAVEQGLVFGKDIVFTLGPYASTYTGQYHPATDWQMIWSSELLSLAFAGGLMALARDRYALSALLTVPMLGLILGPTLLTKCADPLFFCDPFVFILLACRIMLPSTHALHISMKASTLASLALLVVALSLSPLIKGTFGIAALVAIGLVGLLLPLRGHWALAIGVIVLFIAGIALFWVIAGQPLFQLSAFFAAQQAIVDGYSDAMSLPGPPQGPVIYIAASLVLAVLHFRFLRTAGTSGILLAGGFALLLFIGFKAAFVREDGHALIAGGVIAIAGWLSAVGLPGARPLLALIFCLMGWAAIDVEDNDLHIATLSERMFQPSYVAARGFVARFEEKDTLRKHFAESLKKIRAMRSLPPLLGRNDVYSFDQASLLASGLEWSPRPVLQSYSAYNSALLTENANYLAGPKAPDNILFSVQPIDNRLAALDDSLSWPTLLTHYEPFDLIGDIALLRRRSAPAVDQTLPGNVMAEGTYRLGEEIPLPSTGGLLWAKVAVKPTFLGKLLALAYKAPRLEIAFHWREGQINRFRYIAGIGEVGFIVSPLVRSTKDFLALELPTSTGYFSTNRPKSFSISTIGGGGANWAWSQRLTVQLTKMVVSAQPQVYPLIFSESFTREGAGTANEILDSNDCRIDRVNYQPTDGPIAAIGGFLHVQGWAAMSLEDGVAPEHTNIMLQATNGDVYSLPAKLVARSDVNEVFGRPQMGSVGFDAFADISGFHGAYTLQIQIDAGGRTRNCAKRIQLEIAAIKQD